jgi:PAS domain S-box-containing protein
MIECQTSRWRWLRRIHPDDRDRVQQALTRASEARADFHLEYRRLMPDGPIKHLYVAARALTTSSGSLEFLGAAIDVTAAKETEEKRRQDEDELRRITTC